MNSTTQGISSNRYSVIPRNLIFITRGEYVLLLKGAPTKRLWANQYNGIGGHIEQGEDVLTAAYRELYEETGLTCQKLWLCGTVVVDTGSSQTGICIFVVRGEIATGEPVPSSEGTPEWVATSQLPDIPLVEDLPSLLPRILSMEPGDPPFSAISSYDTQGKLTVKYPLLE